MCIYNFLSLYTKQKQNLYTSVYKSERGEQRESGEREWESGERDFWREATDKLWVMFSTEHN